MIMPPTEPLSEHAPRVLMLEDDEAVVQLVRERFAREGFRLEHASTVGGALDRARAFRPDVVLLDVQLPDGDGYSVCAELRADPLLNGTSVIFLTQHSDLASRLRGFAAGAQDYLAKPFEVEELVARVRAQLQLKKGRAAPASRAPDFFQSQGDQREWTLTLVHDLRSPLGSVKLTLDLIKTSGQVTDPELARLVSNADAATDFLLFLINDLLDLDAGRLETTPGPLDPGALLERLSELFAAPLRSRRQILKISAAPGGPVRSDELLLFRSLANLLTNAMKFSPEGSLIELSLERLGNSARFAVRDRGQGVPDDEKERVFEKYYRGKGALRKTAPGSGIGLAFCRLAAEALGGRVWVEDAEGGGSRFLFEIRDDGPTSAPALSGELFGPEILAEYRAQCTRDLDGAQAQARLLAESGAEAAEQVKRVAHRLAGSAGTYGFPRASKLARDLETKLEGLLDSGARWDASLSQATLGALDQLRRELLTP